MIEKPNVKQAQKQLSRDYEQLYVISAIAKAIQSKIDDEHVRRQCQDLSIAKTLVKLGLTLTQGIFRTSSLGVGIS